MMRRIAVSLLGIAGVALVGIATTAAAPKASLEAYPNGTYISEVGVRVDGPTPGDKALISEARAISLASDASGDLADPSKPFSVQLCRFTDERYGPDGGPPLIEDRLVWLVRFTGTAQPVYGPKTPKRVATELNVVIDASTGQYLEAFSFR